MDFNGHEIPQVLRASFVAARYRITERLAAEWLRRLVSDGVCRKIGKWAVGKPSEVDAWVANGGRR